MKPFVDNAGHSWSLDITIGAAKRVKALLGVNLLKPTDGDPPLMTRLGTDLLLLVDVIFVIIKPQADAANVTDEQFGAALGGEAVLAASTAFWDELLDFFQRSGRADHAKALSAQRQLIDMAIKRIETRIDKMDLETTLGEPSTSLPESSASIQTP